MSYTENNFKEGIKKLSNNIKIKLGKKNTKFYKIKNKEVKNPENTNTYNPVNNINNVIIAKLSKLNEKNLEENSDYKTFTINKKKNTKFRIKHASRSSDSFIIPLLYLIYAYIYVKYNKIEKYSENKKNNVLSVDTLKIIFSHKNPAIKNVNVFLYNSFNKKDNKNNKLVENKNENTSKLKFLMENSSINDKILNVLNKIKIIWDKEEEPVNEYIEIILDFLENFIDILQFLKKIYTRNYKVPVFGTPSNPTYILNIDNLLKLQISNINEVYLFIENLKNINFNSSDKKDYNEKLNNFNQLLNILKSYNLIEKIDKTIFNNINIKLSEICDYYKNELIATGVIYNKNILEDYFKTIVKYNEKSGVKKIDIDKLIQEFENKKELFEKLNDENINFKNNNYKDELHNINKNILEGPSTVEETVDKSAMNVENNPHTLAVFRLKDLTTKNYEYDNIFLSIKNIIENENAFLDNNKFYSINNDIKKYKIDLSSYFRKLEKNKKKNIDEKVKRYEKELKILENKKKKLDVLLAKNNKNEISKIDNEIARLNGEIDRLNRYDYNTEFNKLPIDPRYGYRGGPRIYTDSKGAQILVNSPADYKKIKEPEIRSNIARLIIDKGNKEKEKFEIKQKKDKLAEDKKIIDLQISTYKDSIKKLSINKTNLNNSSKVNNKSDFLNIFDDFINYSDLISKKIDVEQLNKVKDKFYYLLFTKDNFFNKDDFFNENNFNENNLNNSILNNIEFKKLIKEIKDSWSSTSKLNSKNRELLRKLSTIKELNNSIDLSKLNTSKLNLNNLYKVLNKIIKEFKNSNIELIENLQKLKVFFLIYFKYTVINNINDYFERKAKKDSSIFINSLLDLCQKQNPQNESLVFIEQVKKIDDDLTNKIQSTLNKIYINLENKKDKLINIDLSKIKKSTLINTIKENSENYEKNANKSGKYIKVIPYTDIILAYFLELSYIIDILNHVLYEMYK